ncbi:MAG: hypothetical protein AMXMBFR84_19040 [Candidatus Hydrogenedentota bacterium]
MNRLVVALGVVVVVTAAAGAQTLAAFPPAIQLDTRDDVQRMVVLHSLADGVTYDRTMEAAVVFETPGIATWENGKFTPVANGQTNVSVTYGELAVTVPLTVANAELAPPKSFRNDVEPVLMRAGCNSGACHGSAQGKNGFRVSLFGFDPTLDYTNLTREVRARRLNVGNPEESLMLTKAIGTVDHEGGSRFDRESHLYDTLLEWISEGAGNDAVAPPELTGVEILPEAAVLDGEGATQQFVVRALYSDGTDRDVTDLAVMASSDDLTIKLSEGGLITAGGRGEGYLMARFGTFAVVSQAIVLPKGLQSEWPADAVARNYIDEKIFDKLKKLRMQPAVTCDDTTFVRRVFLDILGVLPTAEETRAFLENPAADKRAVLIDQLLERPEFSELWAMKWADLLLVKSDIDLDRKALHRYNDWIKESITANKPLDQFVRELLTSQGGNFTAPAVNFYVAETDPKIVAENVAQVFMGIRLQCAQCHNHPFERWTMDDYYSFAAFFAQIGQKGSSDPREKIVYNRASGEVNNLKNGQVMQPKFLGGAVPDLAGRDRRELLAEWLTAPDNPWFAQTIANRLWQQFLGKGITDPPDDVRVTNPPSHPELLEAMAARLVECNYDLRQIVRDICNSYTYQMSTQPRIPDVRDERNFAQATVRRIDAEQLLDAICQVSETKVKFPNLPLGARAVEVADGASGNYFLSLFGRPSRESVCACGRTTNPTLAQALHLINGDTVTAALQAGDGRLQRLTADGVTVDQALDDLWLAAYARPPRTDEKEKFTGYLAQATDKRAAMEDVFWTVLNSKEFVFNH